MEMNGQKQCICKMCPSYVKCAEPLAYCLPEIGKSKCIASRAGCICPGCPVYAREGFKKDYYCIIGSENS